MNKFLIHICLTILVCLPLLSLAQQDSPGYGQDSPGYGQDSPGVGPTGDDNVGLNNPLGRDSTLLGFIQEIISVILVFAVPLIVFFIILAGFNYVMARGNPAKIGTAHNALLYAVIGGVLILGAWVILEVIKGTIDAFR